MGNGSVIEIYLYPEKGGPATVVEAATAVAGAGLALADEQRGGVFATVFRGGSIRVGDPITLWGQN